MSTNQDLVFGTLVPVGLPDTLCFKSAKEYYESIAKNFKPAFSRSITNVVISSSAPSQDQRESLWIRMSNGGQYIGTYVFSGNDWVQVSPAPNVLERMYGDSRVVPAGYRLADNTNPKLTPAQASFIQSTWHRHSSNLYWDVFDVTYEGI